MINRCGGQSASLSLHVRDAIDEIKNKNKYIYIYIYIYIERERKTYEEIDIHERSTLDPCMS